jgi:hypothetical protein
MKEDFIKEDGCGGSEYEGENLDDRDGIFCFEGGNVVGQCGWSKV